EKVPIMTDILTRRIETLINRLLSMDAEALAGLTKYKGSVVAIDLLNTRTTIYMQITASGITLSNDRDRDADVWIRGTPVELLAYVNAMQQAEPARTGNIEITGNIALAQKVQSVLRNLELDWEEEVSHWLGDTAARKFGNTARQSAAWLKQAGDTVRMDISEYLRYEKEILPDKPELDEFSGSVDTLHNDIERLKVRIHRIRQSIDQDNEK
ncbi:MAG: SCP2 sterol-binding domain-containing protein, partial [Gammaproteobacteria bacterium]